MSNFDLRHHYIYARDNNLSVMQCLYKNICPVCGKQVTKEERKQSILYKCSKGHGIIFPRKQGDRK